MDKPRPCGCKGIRTCLICEEKYGIPQKKFALQEDKILPYVYCPYCEKAWPGWNIEEYKRHPDHTGKPIDFPGIYIKLEFLSPCEEKKLVDGIDEMPWDLSQSGRRKQNFGPKCNFKKQRLCMGDFSGFPYFTKFVQDKFNTVSLLSGYRTVEQCSLEYDPCRGASIDPHIDDCWVWGERIVTVNLLADSVLTMTPYKSEPKRYNLPCVVSYRPQVLGAGDVEYVDSSTVVRIPMPNRSLLIIYGPARYNWEHCVLREDVKARRVCLAYREFTPPYLLGGDKEEEGSVVLQKAKNFWDHKLGKISETFT